ncbi:hypothetical protein P3X46_027565 [Hevea brasiliensis]|uniref:Uncharacterized protein n=1 Tax=Hevea brasiliensis TaxID=3981 RepID=A0ABQ9L073_HEVBR|nr:hypothetical protein P3X46_027565 [Hevea brasiliensis]
MGFRSSSRIRILFTLFTNLFIIISTFQVGAAKRTMHGEQWHEEHFLHIESLQKGPVPPSASSPCTNIPKGGTGHCPNLNEMNFAGGRVNLVPPPPPPTFRSSILMAANSHDIKTKN